MNVAVLVPWRGGCEWRAAAWEWVRARYIAAGVTVVEGRAPDGPWCKAATVADALDRTHAELIVVADADVITDGIPAALDAVRAGAPWAMPHRTVHRLDPETSRRVIAGGELTPIGYDQRPYTGHPGGGVVVLPRATLEAVPLDRRFVGWGQEDDAWAAALVTLAGRPWRGDADLFHLWHPHPYRRTRARGSDSGWALFRRYAAAHGHPEDMRALVDAGR